MQTFQIVGLALICVTLYFTTVKADCSTIRSGAIATCAKVFVGLNNDAKNMGNITSCRTDKLKEEGCQGYSVFKFCLGEDGQTGDCMNKTTMDLRDEKLYCTFKEIQDTCVTTVKADCSTERSIAIAACTKVFVLINSDAKNMGNITNCRTDKLKDEGCKGYSTLKLCLGEEGQTGDCMKKTTMDLRDQKLYCTFKEIQDACVAPNCNATEQANIKECVKMFTAANSDARNTRYCQLKKEDCRGYPAFQTCLTEERRTGDCKDYTAFELGNQKPNCTFKEIQDTCVSGAFFITCRLTTVFFVAILAMFNSHISPIYTQL